MNDSLWRKAGPLIAARFLSAILTVSIPLVLARMLSMAEYGTYKQLFLIFQLLYYVLPFGVAQSLYFFIPRTEARRTYFGQTLFFLLFAALFAGLGLWAFLPRVAESLNNQSLIDYRGILVLYTALSIAAFPLEISLTSRGRTKASAASYLVSDGLRALALTVPVLLGFGLEGAMLTLVAHAAIRAVAAWCVMLWPDGTSSELVPLFAWKQFAAQLRYAVPFGAAILFSIPQQYAHQFAVAHAVSPELFAIYAVGCFQLPLVDLLYTPASEVLMVRLGELDRAGRMREAIAAFRDTVSKLALVFLPSAAFLFAAAPEFIAAAFGTRFLPAVPIFRICLIGIPLAIMPLDGALRARGETRHIFFSYVAKALVTVPLVWWGVKQFGMLGGIAAWAIAEACGKAVLMLRVPRAIGDREAPVRLRDLFPLRSLAKSLMAAVIAAASVGVIRPWANHAWHSLGTSLFQRLLPLATWGFLFLFIYLATLWMVGVRPTQLVNAFSRGRPA